MLSQVLQTVLKLSLDDDDDGVFNLSCVMQCFPIMIKFATGDMRSTCHQIYKLILEKRTEVGESDCCNHETKENYFYV